MLKVYHVTNDFHMLNPNHSVYFVYHNNQISLELFVRV